MSLSLNTTPSSSQATTPITAAAASASAARIFGRSASAKFGAEHDPPRFARSFSDRFARNGGGGSSGGAAAAAASNVLDRTAATTAAAANVGAGGGFGARAGVGAGAGLGGGDGGEGGSRGGSGGGGSGGQEMQFSRSVTERLIHEACPMLDELSEDERMERYRELRQMDELADIAQDVAQVRSTDDDGEDYLRTCLADLHELLQLNHTPDLTVDTFGYRIDKLIREKYGLLRAAAEGATSMDTFSDYGEEYSSAVHDESSLAGGALSRSGRNTPLHAAAAAGRDRTTIDDFEIIKPISKGAYGRVFLARKKITGDLFAIKVLKKSHMVRKNAVESVQAERNILVQARSPF
eukprot:jgi/Mesen1/2994/ME000177S02275